ncbi:sensor histidine kinase [Flavobacterium sp. CS20]|uniref:sensor histidine kinase n=1 Tax=Flavobacterium sp. CS20 TaxID=2775246 RepID=UPI001B39F996|nr:sensor histidine kinase [Flavobacterium sp. CS20]QTY26030.1 histidine kinase [Flavobacterium sp. CS20]
MFENTKKIIIAFGYIARYGLSMALILLVFKILMLNEETQNHQKHIHKLELETKNAQHQQLKNQINPHFFFNTLNSLSSIVAENPDKATDYISYMSKIFRQSLADQPDLVKLKDDIEFVEAFIKLQKLRYGQAFDVNFKLNIQVYNKKVLSMGLQTSLENALKHNIIRKDKPLIINIFDKDHYVWVAHELQMKQNPVQGENFGLSSLQKRAQWSQQMSVIIQKENNIFSVGLPLSL